MLYVDIVAYFGVAFQQLKWNPLTWSSDAKIFPVFIGGSTVFMLLMLFTKQGEGIFSDDDKKGGSNGL